MVPYLNAFSSALMVKAENLRRLSSYFFGSIPGSKASGIIYLVYFSVTAFICSSLSGYIFDDAYIHFRIADNLVNEGLPYYNVSEPFKSSSSTLWTIFLGLIKKITRQEYVNVIPYVNAALMVASCRIWQACIENVLNRRLILLELLVFALGYSSICLHNAIGMMESILAVFVLSSSGYFFSRNRPQLGFAILAISVFCRLEFAIFFLCTSVYYCLFVSKEKTFKYILIGLISVFPLVLFDLTYYGSIYPLTASAKSIVYDLSLKQLILNIVPHATWGGKPVVLTSYLFSILSVVALLRGAFAGLRVKRLNIIQLFGISSLALISAYVYKTVFLHAWYYPLFQVPLYAWLFVVVLGSAKKVNVMALAWLVSLSSFIGFALTVFASFSGKFQYYPGFGGASRVRRYLEVGSAINKLYPWASLMTSEIGGLGYSYKGYIKDGMGLIQPDCLKYHPMDVPDERSHGAIGAIPAGCVDEYKPEIIVSYDVFIEHFSKSKSASTYNIYRYPVYTKRDSMISKNKKNKVFGSDWLNVYIRKDVDKKLPLVFD